MNSNILILLSHGHGIHYIIILEDKLEGKKERK